MASTKASNAKTAWVYTDDDGAEYVVSAKTAYVGGDDAAAFGGSADDGSHESLPNGFRMRRARVRDASKHVKWVPCYSLTATLWTTPNTPVTMDYLGTDTVFASDGTKRDEKKERKPISPFTGPA